MFVILLNSLFNASSYTKCASLSNQKCQTQLTLVNVHPNKYSQKLHYYLHCVKNNVFVKTLNVNIMFSWLSAFCNHIFHKTKIKENIIFSIISDIFLRKSIKQDNDKKMIRELNTGRCE